MPPTVDTQPLPVITISPAGPDREPTRRRPSITPRVVGGSIGLIAVAAAAAVVILNWHAIVAALLTALVVVVVALVALALLIRLLTGGRLGSMIFGVVVALVLTRRRR